MKQPTPVLVLNGDLSWTKYLADLVRNAPLLLAADGGANTLARLGVCPDAVVGDLDSIDPGTRTWIGDERLVHRPDQQRTDFEKGLDFAFEESGVDRLFVLGALGGRLDHTIGNLGVLARQTLGPDLVLITESERVLATSASLDLEAIPGETWSFWTFDPAVRVSLEGVRWPVKNTPLTVGDHPSISNEATSSTIRIEPTGGAVVVYRMMAD